MVSESRLITPEPGALHVAVGVVRNRAGEILIARRHDHLHQGGLWEFPGGKVEAGESVYQALSRELHEEVGIEVLRAEPLLQVRHAYSDRTVFLDTWEVQEFAGVVRGREAQPIQWVPAEHLSRLAFPEANRPIIAAARLADLYGILDEPDPSEEWLLKALSRMCANGVRLVQLRAHSRSPSPSAYRALAASAIGLCRSLGLTLLLNADPLLAMDLGADGVHLSSARLTQLNARPLPDDVWVAASCHDLAELRKAEELGVDFAVVSPVLRTATHPSAVPLGWQAFRQLAAQVNLPVYALGGMTLDCLAEARQNGGRGIAGIRSLVG